VTDPENAIDDEPAPELIATHFLTGVDEVVEHLRAADLLGLGVRLSSYVERDGDDGKGYSYGYELELLTASALRAEDESEEA
jgi:hypothetical protein